MVRSAVVVVVGNSVACPASVGGDGDGSAALSKRITCTRGNHRNKVFVFFLAHGNIFQNFAVTSNRIDRPVKIFWNNSIARAPSNPFSTYFASPSFFGVTFWWRCWLVVWFDFTLILLLFQSINTLRNSNLENLQFLR